MNNIPAPVPSSQRPVGASRRGRNYSTNTALGRLMDDMGLYQWQVAHAARINARILSDYTAGRKEISPVHLARLSEALDVEPEDILG